MTLNALHFNRSSVQLGQLSRAEWIIYWAIVLTPLWWLLGIQTLLYPFIISSLLAVNFNFEKLVRTSIPACVWAWFSMAIVMLWTAILGLDNLGFNPLKTAAALVTFFKSYFLIFACLLLPFLTRVRLHVITRAVTWMSIGYLVTIATEMVMLVLRIAQSGYLPPLARLAGGDAATLRIVFASIQPFFHIPLPRTLLYTPDPPIAGVCTVLSFMICLGETNQRLRKLALAGSLAGLLVCFSRLAWICLPLEILIAAAFHNGLIRQGFLWVASFIALTSSILGLSLSELINKSVEIFSKARAESSEDRALVIRKTLEAWQEFPWFGWGVIQGSVRWYIYDVPLGSFSTYPSVLYLHGIFGFAFFGIALISTLWSFLSLSIRGNLFHRWAFASLIALYILLNGTPLSWMAVYIWFFFIWLGAILSETNQQVDFI